MLESFGTSVAVLYIPMEEVPRGEGLIAVTALARKFGRSNTHVFERISLNPVGRHMVPDSAYFLLETSVFFMCEALGVADVGGGCVRG